ncbi:MAG: hypothetical protein H6559_00165 [Lewinellaceae bacterium]|nr:hypothetical protein [Lewinellaceae bacterium]
MAQNPPTPVLLFGFSNDSQRPLDMLKTESTYVWQVLKELDKRELIKVIREESLTNDELVDYLLDFQDTIAAIHFAGHGSGQALYTEGGATAPQGLKKILVLSALNTGI